MSGEDSGFLVIPAVDIRGGRCVRLWRGLAERQTVFDEDPVGAALRWQEEGARYLHVVDLDGAFEGSPVNAGTVKEIARALDIPVEVGGGIRTRKTALDYVEAGLARVVVGTAAFDDPAWLREATEALGDRLVAGIDVKEGMVAVRGWMGVSREKPDVAARRLVEAGVRRIIYTDTLKDGTLEGPNFEGIAAIAEASRVPVIAAGGVSSVEDVSRIAGMSELGVEGVITGMALYRGRFTLPEALGAIRERSQ